MSPGNLLLVTSMGFDIFLSGGSILFLESVLVLRHYRSSDDRSLGGALAILGDDTKLSGLSVGLVCEKCSAIKRSP